MNELLKKENGIATFLKDGLYDIPTYIKVNDFSIVLVVDKPEKEIGIHIDSNVVFSVTQTMLFIKTVNTYNNKEQILYSRSHNLWFENEGTGEIKSSPIKLTVERLSNKLSFSCISINSDGTNNECDIDYSLIYKKTNVPCGVYGKKDTSFTSFELNTPQPEGWIFEGDVVVLDDKLSISNGGIVTYEYHDCGLENTIFGFRYKGDGYVLIEDKVFRCKDSGIYFCDLKDKENANIKISSDTNIIIDNPQIIDSRYFLDLKGNILNESKIQYTFGSLDNNNLGVSFDLTKISEWEMDSVSNKYNPIQLIDFTSNDLDNPVKYLSVNYQRYNQTEEDKAVYYDGTNGAVYSGEDSSDAVNVFQQNTDNQDIYLQHVDNNSIKYIHIGKLKRSGEYSSNSCGELNIFLQDSFGKVTQHIIPINNDMHFLEKDFYSRLFLDYSGTTITISIRVSYLLKIEDTSNAYYSIKNYNSSIPNVGIANANGEKCEYQIFENNGNYTITLDKKINTKYIIIENTNADFNYTFSIDGLSPQFTNIDILNNETGVNIDNIAVFNSENNLNAFRKFINENIIDEYIYYTTFDDMGDNTFINFYVDDLNPAYPISCYGYIDGKKMDYKQLIQLNDSNSLYETKMAYIDDNRIIQLEKGEIVKNARLNNFTPVEFYQYNDELFIKSNIENGEQIIYTVYYPYTFCVNYQNGKYMITASNPVTDFKIMYSDTSSDDYFIDHINLNPYFERNNNGFIYIDDKNTLKQIECEYNKKELRLDGRDRICIVVTALGVNRSISNNYEFEFYLEDTKLPYNKYVNVEFEEIDTTQSGSHVLYLVSKPNILKDAIKNTLIIRDKMTGFIESFEFTCKGDEV